MASLHPAAPGPIPSARRRLAARLARAEVLLPALCLACLVWNIFPFLQLFSAAPAYIHGFDNNYYFAWAHSLVVDGDIDFENDLEFVAHHPGLGQTPAVIRAELEHFGRTDTGLVRNRYGVGTGLLALPLVAPMRPLLALVALLRGTAADPFSRWYAAAFIASGVLWGFLGLYVSLMILRERVAPKHAALAVLLATLGLSLGHYIWFEPTMSHATGFGVLAVFLWLTLRWELMLAAPSGGAAPEASRLLTRARIPFAMGLLLGLAVAVRYTNVVFAIVPFALALGVLRERPARDRGAVWRRCWVSLGVAALGAFVAFSPQLFAWKILFGDFLYYSYEEQQVYAWPIHLPQILFGTHNSLFLWTPLALPACLGLGLRARRGDTLAMAGLGVIAAVTWIYGSWQYYNLGHSFGMRAYVESSLFFMLGLGELARRIAARWNSREWPRQLLVAAATLLVVWNIYFLFAYRAEVQPPGEPFAGMELLTRADEVFAQIARDLKINRLGEVLRRLGVP